MGSLTGMLSNSFSRVITHAREEYLYVYSVYVLEASTSNRLTHFYRKSRLPTTLPTTICLRLGTDWSHKAPFNLLALGIFRPLRLFLPSDDKFRQGRILLLRATHAPIVAIIQVYEWFTKKVNPDGFDNFRGPRQASFKKHSAPPLDHPDSRPRSGYRPRMPASRPASSELVIHKPHPRQVPEDDTGDAPTDVEVRISELAAKIDRLTALVVALQSGAGIETVRT